MSIQRKVLFAFITSFALLLGTTILAWLYQSSLAAAVVTLTEARAPTARAIAVMREAKTDVARAYAAASNLRIPISSRREVEREGHEALQRFDAAWARFEAIPHTDAGWRAWREGTPALKRWREAAERAIASQKDRDALIEGATSVDDPRVQEADRAAMAGTMAARDANKGADPVLRGLDDLVDAVVEKEGAAAADSSRRGRTVMLVAMLLGTVAIIVIAWRLLRSLSRAIQGLTASAAKLLDAFERGDLDVRADSTTVSTEFRPVIDGSNAIMESTARRFRVISEYMDRISRGDLPPHIATETRGEFTRTRDAINRCVDAVGAVVADGKALADAAVTGELRARGDAARHQGDFRRIIEGFNATLDAVVTPIDEAKQVLERLADRDLRARVQGRYLGDHAKIKEALNATAEALHETMAQVAQAADQVSSASGQIAASSQAVASGASEQASSLEQTSASLESMASMTKQATGSAQQANGLAQRAKAAASEGGAAMEQMTGAMAKIKASAQGTSQIIKDINEIAFQTNLLALNAAVEAARAGEAGRGFAVVAEEVRSLALRSKEAANKTEELIRQSVKEAGEGEVTARHVHEKLGEIAGAVVKVTDIVAEIAAAAREQAAGIDQVTKAVAQMNQVTQQNAASSEESSSAAAELSGQSEELAAMVATFQIERAAGPAGSAATARPTAAHAKPNPIAAPAKPHPAAGVTRRRANGDGGAIATLSPAQIIPLDGEPAFGDF